MSQDKLRRRIAWEAARLIYFREETEYHRARTKAARRICRGEAPLGDLPTNREIREQIEAVARAFEGERRGVELGEMRLEALRIMQILKEYSLILSAVHLRGMFVEARRSTSTFSPTASRRFRTRYKSPTSPLRLSTDRAKKQALRKVVFIFTSHLGLSVG